jgi:hypothetical protein
MKSAKTLFIGCLPHLRSGFVTAVSAAFFLNLSPRHAPAQTLGTDFSTAYSVRDVGAAGDLLTSYGALLFKAADPDTLLVGAPLGDTAAKIYQIKVTRDAQKHITGFAATASVYADAPGVASGWGIDGGMDYAPNGVLFYTSSHEGGISQIKPGSTTPSKQGLMSDLGIDGGGGGLLFVPAGFSGAGSLKLSGAMSFDWLSTSITPDGSGTYNIAPVGSAIEIANYGQGLAYVKAGKPAFVKDSVLIACSGDDRVVAYEVDANGDPVPSTQRDFLTGFYENVGLTADPVTGDFLVANSDFNNPHILVIGNMSVGQTQVRITSPADGSSFTAPATLQVEAEASQTNGAITRVDFYQGTTLLSSATGPFFSIQAELTTGQYTLAAVAIDGGGNATTSAPVHISVVNHGPGVTLLFPTNNTVLRACSDLTLAAQVQLGNSDIASVTFFDGATTLGVSHAPYDFKPYQWSELDLDGGTNTFSVWVTDNNGVSSVAVATNVVVLPLPLNTLSIHHYVANQLRFCFRGAAGSNYVWETTSSLTAPQWTPFLTNAATGARIQVTNQLDSSSRSGFFRTQRAK